MCSSSRAAAPEMPAIHIVRSQRVMLDADLARLYGVKPMAFNQAIKRNAERFPDDFAFKLTREEVMNLKSQTVISSSPIGRTPFGGHGGTRKEPWAFTEHGALMAAMLPRSPHAVAMCVYVVRAFVRMREELLSHTVILKRLAKIDKQLLEHDLVLRDVVEKLLPLLSPEEAPPKRRIGFHGDEA